ncbi:MAG: choice-of-anchor D domain-containing protein [Phycisphaerales bacterium]|nr:choice-of-anchor D domain-containing protein [Phycisphaerales bacterium]
MKRILQAMLCLPSLLAVGVQAQTFTGPSSSQTPYVIPVTPGVKITSILTTGDSVGGYKMAGLPDGMGAYDNNDGTFTVLIAHEMGNTVGIIRNHGSIGAYVSRWVINKSDLKVIDGGDLMQRVNLWDVATSKYKTYSSYYPSSLAAFGRFCSADLAPVGAYYNSKTGNGTTARIFMCGEETGTEGRVVAHISSGPNMGTTYEVPRLGKASWENYVARGRESDTTVMIGMDDATPGQVYVYIGTKTNSGTDIEKAGMTNGKLYGIAVSGFLTETSASVFPSATVFALANLGDVSSLTGATINTNSNTLGITTFLRPEDGAWDPANDSNFYFNTTNAFGSPSRLWKLTFFNPDNLTAGGKITAVLDGTEGQQMFDNMSIDNWGHSIHQEDVGNNAHLGKIWQYDFAKDSSKIIATHDSTRFLTGGSKFLTQDEEASGVIDMQEILGPGMFLFVDQAHHATTPELVENGQLLALYNPDTYNSNPEVSVSGNGLNISKDDLFPSIADNTDFGTIDTGMKVTKVYTIKNAGPGKLNITNIGFSGVHASEFTLIGAPSFPTAINAGDSLKLNVQFAPKVVGLRIATVTINNNDFDEKIYAYALQGVALNNRTGIANTTAAASFVKLFPNPTGDLATISINLKKEEHFEISVLDLNGRKVMETIAQNFQSGENKIGLNTSSLPNGSYIVEVASSNQTISIKMLIAH